MNLTWTLLLTLLVVLTLGCEAPALPQASSAAKGSASTTAPPALGAPMPLEAGVRFYETTLQREGVPMKVWLYVPDQAAGKKLPCVLVAPAGSNLVTGMTLGDGDRAEHLPYAQKGFVVAAYEIDGHVPDMKSASQQEIMGAMKAFKEAQAGVSNARAALDLALANVPAIDAERIYAAGHSSAATLALQVAFNDDRIAGCVAFAPATDLEAHLGADLTRQLEPLIPGFGEFIASSSPRRRVGDLKCPVFLFHASDDGLVKADALTRFADELKQSNDRVTVVEVPRGGHYDSMINEGVPRAIEWMSGFGG